MKHNPNTPPVVSIVMPAYNAADRIQRSIASAQAQTYPHWELLVVDDCSQDGTAAVVQRLQAEDPRIRLIAHTRNQGPAGARNTALAAAQGRYVAFLDSDDIWQPTKLAAQLEHMRKTGTALCYTQFSYVDAAGQTVRRPLPFSSEIDYDMLLKKNTIGCLTVLVDRASTGDFHFEDIGHEDYALWLDLLRQGHRASGVAEILAHCRVRDGSVSSNKLRAALWTWRIHRRNVGMLQAGWYFLHYALIAVLKRRSLLREQRYRSTAA